MFVKKRNILNGGGGGEVLLSPSINFIMRNVLRYIVPWKIFIIAVVVETLKLVFRHLDPYYLVDLEGWSRLLRIHHIWVWV